MSSVIKDYTLQAIRGVKHGTEQSVLETAINVTAQAKDLAPVDTANLKGSIMWKTGSKAGGYGEQGATTSPALTSGIPKGGAIVGSACEYAVYQEYGTRKMFAQPYLRPAVDMVARDGDLQTAMYKAMFDSVAKELKKK